MTAGVVHVTNLTPPGSECNPVVRWLSRGWRVLPGAADTSVAGAAGAAGAGAAVVAAAAAAGASDADHLEEVANARMLRHFNTTMDRGGAVDCVVADDWAETHPFSRSDKGETFSARGLRNMLLPDTRVLDVDNAPCSAPITPSAPSPGARYLSRTWSRGSRGSRGGSLHRRARSYIPSSFSSYAAAAYTAADDLFLSVPLLPPPPPSPSTMTPSTSSSSLLSTMQMAPLPSPSPPAMAKHHRRSFSLNIDDECRRRRRAAGRRAYGQQQAAGRPRASGIAIAFAEEIGGGGGGGDDDGRNYVSVAVVETPSSSAGSDGGDSEEPVYSSSSSTGNSSNNNNNGRKTSTWRCIGGGGGGSANRRSVASWGDAAIRILANIVVRFRWLIVLAAAGGLVVSIAVARNFGPPPTTGVTLYPDGHNVNLFAAASSLFGFAQIEVGLYKLNGVVP
jgi:hypothetical protein